MSWVVVIQSCLPALVSGSGCVCSCPVPAVMQPPLSPQCPFIFIKSGHHASSLLNSRIYVLIHFKTHIDSSGEGSDSLLYLCTADSPYCHLPTISILSSIKCVWYTKSDRQTILSWHILCPLFLITVCNTVLVSYPNIISVIIFTQYN